MMQFSAPNREQGGRIDLMGTKIYVSPGAPHDWPAASEGRKVRP